MWPDVCGCQERHRRGSLVQVRNNQVPNPRAMVEDILARASLLDAELARCSQHQGIAPTPAPAAAPPDSPGAASSAPAVQAAERREQPAPSEGQQQELQLSAGSDMARSSQVCFRDCSVMTCFFQYHNELSSRSALPGQACTW